MGCKMNFVSEYEMSIHLRITKDDVREELVRMGFGDITDEGAEALHKGR